MGAMTPNRVFAIGLKNYIELRVAHQPPKKIVTKFEKPVQVKVYEGSWNWGDTPKFKIVDKQLKIVTTFYTGGRVLCIITRRKFLSLTDFRWTSPVRVRTGEMKELPPWSAQAFLDRKWRKQHHV